jgi:hemerythrin
MAKKIDIVTWQNSYSMGIKLIDEQHKGLLEIVNDLYSHAAKNDAEEHAYFKDVIAKAVNYTKVHFATEEKIMIATKFPEYNEHKKAHEDFILNIVKTAKDFDSGKRMVLVNFTNYLKDWILSHIAIIDVKYSEYFKKIASRKEDGKLSITSEDIEKIAMS